MTYKKVIAKTLQDKAPIAVNMHKIENHFIMDINYDLIVDSIVDELESNGYTIIQGSSSVG